MSAQPTAPEEGGKVTVLIDRCPLCRGKGKRHVHVGKTQADFPCPRCNGTGKLTIIKSAPSTGPGGGDEL